MVSAEVKRALAVAAFPAAEPTLETLLHFLVQRRQTRFELSIGSDGRWHAVAGWPGPDRALEADGLSPDDAVAKIVLEVMSRERPPQSSSR